ncbi:MAG TPA: RNA polymerase factor sigma-54 [Cyclobacteriaceae bacterium]
MQKLNLTQSLSQKLSPQQIQFIKLLQVPTAELETRIEEELEANPALEEGSLEQDESQEFEETPEQENEQTDFDIDDYLNDDYSGYKMQGDGPGADEDDKSLPMPAGSSLQELLINQLGFLRLTEREYMIGKQIIGSIDNDGYVRRDLGAIVNDLAFSQNLEVALVEVKNVLSRIQNFDPPGIAARNLKECLLIQLERKLEDDESNSAISLAHRIVSGCFDEFIKKHFDKIKRKLNVDSEENFKKAISVITHLNPKPGYNPENNASNQYLHPDFIVTNNNGKIELSLNAKNAPELHISRSYSEMLDTYDKAKKKDKKLRETVSFVKQKLDAAKWFIDAIKQRQQTLLHTMEAIIEFQYDFFIDGDESKLHPMILKDIADKINMDISTVSRVANSKSVQTEFGIYPLKYFFSEGISTDTGEDVSSREVKNKLKEFINHEDKKKPLSDDKLEKLLKGEGYQIARRTVAKYREQLNIPVARLRKELL